jgi:hypothetical protein
VKYYHYTKYVYIISIISIEIICNYDCVKIGKAQCILNVSQAHVKYIDKDSPSLKSFMNNKVSNIYRTMSSLAAIVCAPKRCSVSFTRGSFISKSSLSLSAFNKLVSCLSLNKMGQEGGGVEIEWSK